MGAYDDLIADAEGRYGLPPGLLAGIINRGERSGVDATSPKGAHGIAQFMPATAAQYGVNTSDPASSIDGAGRLMADHLKRFDGDVPKAVAAYNAGPGAVERHGGVPPYPETQAYVGRVVGGLSGADIFGDAQEPAGGPPAGATGGDGADIFAAPTRPEQVLNTATGEVKQADAPLAVSQAYRALQINPQAQRGSKDNPYANWKGSGYVPAPGDWVVDENGLHQTAMSSGDPGTPKDGLEGVLRGVDAFGRSAANGLTGGWLEKSGAAVSALPKLIEGGGKAWAGDYSRRLSDDKARDAADARDVPEWTMGGGALGFLGQGALVPEAKAAGVVGRLGQGALQGAALSALNSSGQARGDITPASLGGLLLDTVGGAVMGAGAGGLVGPRLGKPSALPQQASLQDYARTGVDPVAAVTGSPAIQQVSQQLRGLPFIGSPLTAAATRTSGQLEKGVADIGAGLGRSLTPLDAGTALQRGAADATSVLQKAKAKAYAPVNALEADTTRVPASNTQAAIQGMFDAYPTNPEWLERQAPTLRAMRDDLKRSGGQTTFGELRRMRTDIGDMVNTFGEVGGVDQGRLKQLYGALSDDAHEAAGALGGVPAQKALANADALNEAAQERITTALRPLLKQGEGDLRPEAAYNKVFQMASKGAARGDANLLHTIKATLDPADWQEVGAGAIAQMGQDKMGFSPAKFSTAFNNLSARGQRALFGDQADDLAALARIANDQSAAGKFYNHSQSGNMATAVGALSTAGTALAAGRPEVAAGMAALAGIGRAASSLLASPGFARMVSRGATPGRLDAFAARNPALAPALRSYRRAIGSLLPNAVGHTLPQARQALIPTG